MFTIIVEHATYDGTGGNVITIGKLRLVDLAGSERSVHEEYVIIALFELLVWPHEVEPWFHTWYRGRVETLDAKYNQAYINSTLCGYTNSLKRATLTITQSFISLILFSIDGTWMHRVDNKRKLRTSMSLFTHSERYSYLLVWPHEVEPWFHSWYRGRVEILDAKHYLCSL